MLGLLAAVFVASLAGSLHCAGMCGGLVAFVTAGNTTRGFVPVQLLYHLSRGAAYLVLGGIAGALGAAVDFSGTSLGIGRSAVILAGVLMVAYGVAGLLRNAGWLRAKAVLPPLLARLFARGHRYAAARGPLLRASLVGGLTAALPCGWLYAFVLTAAASGSPWTGALVMLAFWLGTLPVLIAFAFGIQHLARPLARRLPLLAPWLLVALGLVALSGRYHPPAFAGRGAVVDANQSAPAPGQDHPAPTPDAGPTD